MSFTRTSVPGCQGLFQPDYYEPAIDAPSSTSCYKATWGELECQTIFFAEGDATIPRMEEYGGWEIVEPLGGGGQSDVFKVRTRERATQRANISHNLPKIWVALELEAVKLTTLASAMYNYARPEKPNELAALKVFKIPEKNPERDLAIGRLENEIAVLSENLPGMLKLLAANKVERWIVTELMTGGTLEDHPDTFKGDAYRALKAFRPLVNTLTILHPEKKVHRDIKPANVFIGNGERLVLGDFGIVYLPDQERLTLTNERVGPRDYMPQWANLGERHENVEPNFDVYMLGKLLWCMVSGRSKLPREWHKKPPYNLVELFPDDDGMPLINSILDKCLVEEAEHCLLSAKELLEYVDHSISLIESGGQLHASARRCRVCGRGYYIEDSQDSRLNLSRYDQYNRQIGLLTVAAFRCSYCAHYEFFAPGSPEKQRKELLVPPKS
jgi:serine/threonine protein kinase